MRIDCSKTETYFAEKKRMTEQNTYPCCQRCIDCPLSSENNGEDLTCTDFEILYPKRAIEIVQKWSDEHPQKTKKEAFLEAFPKARIYCDGYPSVAACHIFGLPRGIDNCTNCKGCVSVWDEPAEVEE